MTRRGVLLLGVGAAIVAAGAIAVVMTGETTRTEAVLIGQPVFPGVAARLAEARTVEIRKHDATLTLARGADGTWGLADRGGFPVRADRVRELFAGLGELRLIEERTGNPELFSRLGLEDVTVTGGTSQLLSVKDGQGRVIAEAILGRRRIRTAGNLPEAIYVRRPGENRTFLAEGQLRADTDPMLWIEREVLDIKRQRIATATAHRAGEEPVTVVRENPAAEQATMADMPEGFRPDQGKIDDLPRALEWMTFNDVRPAAAVAAGTPAGEARFTSFDGLILTLRVVTVDDKRWALVSAGWEDKGPRPEGAPPELRTPEEAKAEAEALTRRHAPWAYQLVDWKTDILLLRREDMQAPPPRDPS
jgi:hypothetical protein